MSGLRDSRLQTRVTFEEQRDFEALCREIHRSPSDVLREIARTWVRETGEQVAKFRNGVKVKK